MEPDAIAQQCQLLLTHFPAFDLPTALANYTPADETEKTNVLATQKFLATQDNLYARTNLQGHVTGSGFLFNRDYSKVLLTHHKALNDWFQFGGHSDGDANTLRVAIRETLEESGCAQIRPLTGQIFDVDLQQIPANAKKKEPAHFHYDMRFTFITDDEQFQMSDESTALRWFTMQDYAQLPPTAPRQRFLRKWADLRG
ncbi:MAG: NUDIX hydrolase [Prevotella sp.]|nr:NUDIX hydrolase [Prevotella sp.]